jgi:hypothetical protein
MRGELRLTLAAIAGKDCSGHANASSSGSAVTGRCYPIACGRRACVAPRRVQGWQLASLGATRSVRHATVQKQKRCDAGNSR